MRISERVLQMTGLKVRPADRNAAAAAETSTESAAKTNAADQGGDLWRTLGSEYDVRNATFDELKDLGSRLYKAGAISLRELGAMTLDTGRLRQPPLSEETIRFNNATVKKDWIGEFAARAAFNEKNGNPSGAENDRQVAEDLSRLIVA